MKLHGAVAVVTGGGSGIGAALARRFAREGAAGVVVADRDGAAAEAVAAGIGGLAVAADVSQEAGTLAIIAKAEARYGAIDLFCANAGVSATGGLELPDAAWQRLWQINVMAHLHAARALLPKMVARGSGYLLFTASAAGLLSQFDAPYAVTKHAAVGFAEWLAITYGSRGIGVGCLCPGGVDTPMFRAETPERQALMSARVVSADDVADCVVQALDDGRFLILPHPEVRDYLERKVADPERWLRGMSRRSDVAYEIAQRRRLNPEA